MKLMLHPVAAAIAVAMTGPLGGQEPERHGDPYVPVGTLRVTPEYVPVGTQPSMDWAIDYPEEVTDLVIKTPESSLLTKVPVRVKVRVVGVAFQSGKKHLPVALWTRVGDSASSWELIFEGKFRNVDPLRYVFDEEVPANTLIDFSARGGTRGGGWSDSRTTGTGDLAVTGLANGDLPPSYAPAYDQGNIESFLTGFIGKSNNGHGNNLDGVDMSNPGASTGTSGSVETDPTVDDEAKRVSLGPKEMIYLFELGSRDLGTWYFDMQDLVMVISVEPAGSH